MLTKTPSPPAPPWTVAHRFRVLPNLSCRPVADGTGFDEDVGVSLLEAEADDDMAEEGATDEDAGGADPPTSQTITVSIGATFLAADTTHLGWCFHRYTGRSGGRCCPGPGIGYHRLRRFGYRRSSTRSAGWNRGTIARSWRAYCCLEVHQRRAQSWYRRG